VSPPSPNRGAEREQNVKREMNKMKNNRKWQLFSLVLTAALVASLSVNTWQTYNGSHGGSDGNNSSNDDVTEPMNFTFTWGPENQRIINGTFGLKVWFALDGENLTMIIKTNDDDYSVSDYIGLVFDSNQNGYIDTGDRSYALLACNYTCPLTELQESGYLKFLVWCIMEGPHKVTFSDEGYTFIVKFPFHDWNPGSVIKRGSDNPMHMCFYDISSDPPQGVFVRFSFYTPE
jgi:hypothetical protein